MTFSSRGPKIIEERPGLAKSTLNGHSREPSFLPVIGAGILTRVFYIFFGAAAVTYILFQKKLLPKPISKVVSKIFFIPTLPITVLLRLGNLWTSVDDTIILGCAPVGFLGHPDKLHKLGVRGVVNMCSEYSGPTSYYSTLGIKQLRLPTVDHFEPSLIQLQEAVAFINEYKRRGEKVYVHCKAGHGRAAAVALCWMLNENPDMSPKDINALIRKKRKIRATLYEQKCVHDFISSTRNKM